MDSKEVFHCLAEYDDLDESNDSVDGQTDTVSLPLTPHTPNTPASIDDQLDQSTSSVSMDSAVGSPTEFNMPGSVINLCTLTPAANTIRMNKRTRREHIDNEKKRRDRIKDSCEQLRVLLPYIRGRKTDMASILEMTVDYIKIVNMHMPKNVHNQIVETLQSTDGTMSINDRDCGGKASAAIKKQSGVRGKSRGLGDSNKRIKMEHALSSLPNTGLLDEPHLDPTVAGHSEHSLPAYGNHKVYTTVTEQVLPRGFTLPSYPDTATFTGTPQVFNTYPTSSKTANYHDNGAAAVYQPGLGGESTLFQYYPTLVPNSARIYPDFLSPGSVQLPPRQLQSSDLLVCANEDKPHDLNNNFMNRPDH